MKAVILVGGEGTRMRPLTYATPKPLLPICNQPFLERQLSWLASHGVDEAVLAMGYLPRAFHERFPSDRFGDVRLRYAVEPEPLGTGGAIRFAAEGTRERVVVCNGDVLTDLDLTAMVRFHEEAGAEATISLARVDDPSAFGVVPTARDGRVLAFVEKPPPGKAPTDWINAGSYVLEPSVLERIPAGVTVSVERETFPRTLESGGALYAMQSDAYWLDIGKPREFLQANRDVLAGCLGRPPVAGAEERSPGVWVQGECDVDDDAWVEPPALFGAGASVAAGAIVDRSVVGPGATVGARARVQGSVLLAGAVVEEAASVSDAVVGAGARILAGASVGELTVVGDGAVVEPGTRMAGARIHPPDMPLPEGSAVPPAGGGA